jgi:hypothetical protein
MPYRVVTRFRIVYTVAVSLPHLNQCLSNYIAIGVVDEATNNRRLAGSPIGSDRLTVSKKWASLSWNGPNRDDSVALGTAGYELASTRADMLR